MAAAEWIGFYIVTRSPKSLVSWLTALVLWTLGAYFFYTAIAVNETVTGLYAWAQQFVVIVAPIWFHITVLLTGGSNVRFKLPWSRWNRIAVPILYLYGLTLIAVSFSSRLVVIPVTTNSVNYQNAPGPLYALVIVLLIVCLAPSLLNLWRAAVPVRDPNLKSRYTLLTIATILATAGGLYLAINLFVGTGLPEIIGDGLLAAGVLLLGFAVGRFSAFVEGRSMNRDFFYTALGVGALTICYTLVLVLLYLGGKLSFLALALGIVGMVAANSLFDGVRITLDRIFYQGRFRELRANLRALSREAGTGASPEQRLSAILHSLCNALGISSGLIALKRGDQYVVYAAQDAQGLDHAYALETLDAKEIIGLAFPTRKGLQGMALLIPLIARGEQSGAIVLGAREQDPIYQEQDLELLEDLADQIAQLLNGIDMQQDHAQEINDLVVQYRERERSLELELQQVLATRQTVTPRIRSRDWDEDQLVGLVEDALRHIHDYSYLGEHKLVNLRRVRDQSQKRAGAAAPTLLDRGKALSEELLTLLDSLKPNTAPPKPTQIAAREWHQYTILYETYVLEEMNREVMSKLYISEGTFNRTRRRAIRAIAKTLGEAEGEELPQ